MWLKHNQVNWAQERFEEIQQQISGFLTMAGYQSKNISFVPCSGLNGDNVAHPATESRANWYKGQTLVQLLDDSSPMGKALGSPFRMTISDVFRGGTVYPLSVSGGIEAGSVQVGDAILAMPSCQRAYIKAIEVDNQSNDWAIAGQVVVLHLTDIDPTHLQ